MKEGLKIITENSLVQMRRFVIVINKRISLERKREEGRNFEGNFRIRYFREFGSRPAPGGREHRLGDKFDRIAHLSSGYRPPNPYQGRGEGWA